LAERLLIDGRSGSGKTELARAVVDAWPRAQLVRLDDVYPGWDGLDAGSRAVARILTEHRWRAWDWHAGRPGRWHELDASRPVVVEGVGAISRVSAALADLAVWVEFADDAERKRRALARDGDDYETNWHRWAAQEDAFIARERPRELADLVDDGMDAVGGAQRILAALAP
jgi:uridine kinase